jgi:hypothetical protein
MKNKEEREEGVEWVRKLLAVVKGKKYWVI